MAKQRILRRSQLVGAIFLLLFFVVVYRFYVLQVVEASQFQEDTANMYHRETVLQGERGDIYDQYGRILATNTPAYNVVATLSEEAGDFVSDAQQTAEKLAPILDMSEERLLELLSQEDQFETQLGPGGWKIDQDAMEEIEQLDLDGIHFVEDAKRYYPNHDFAAHLLGYVNHEGEALMGLEASLQEHLQGKDGKINFQTDNRGHRLPQGIEGVEPPADGHHVYLTIDERIQLFVEQALDEIETQYAPQNMSVIVSDPQTGKILAMSNRPSFNPNHYSEIENYTNQAVANAFEPGSTFKIVTLAAAVEEGVYQGEHTFQSGTYDGIPGDDDIHDHNRDGWGEITYLEGVQKSSNVAFAKLGEKLGKETFYRYMYDFGFSTQTGIDLPGESAGYIRAADEAVPIELANMAFGHGLTVTPLQMIQATNIIANDGTLMKPYIIDHLENSQTGETVKQNEPEVVQEQVISSATAAEVRDILETVVTEGTGQNFYIDGYEVAGKTGTAQKVRDGKYQSDAYIHSFTGFAPKDDPQLSVYVMVDSPQVDASESIVTQGGAVVAQLFKSVMHQSLQYLSVAPNEEKILTPSEEEDVKEMNDYTGGSIKESKEEAENDGYGVKVLGDGTVVDEQLPAPGSKVLPGESVYFLTGTMESMDVPDFSGWSLKEARDWAQLANVELAVSGHGYVVQQSIEEGKRIRQGELLELELGSKYTHAE